MSEGFVLGKAIFNECHKDSCLAMPYSMNVSRILAWAYNIYCISGFLLGNAILMIMIMMMAMMTM